MDERPRTDTEDNWLLTIIRIPLQQQGSIPYITIPIGKMCIRDRHQTVGACNLSAYGRKKNKTK